jgi:hypothetical protein
MDGGVFEKAFMRAMLRLRPHAYASTAFGQQYSQIIASPSFHFTPSSTPPGVISFRRKMVSMGPGIHISMVCIFKLSGKGYPLALVGIGVGC